MSMNSIPLSDLASSNSAKFENIGDSHAGRITAINQRPQTGMDGSPLTFPDGTARLLWAITIERSDGETVTLFAKGGRYTPESGSGESMLSAIGSAVRAAEASGVDIGGELAVQYTGQADAGPGKKAKLYTAQYRPPAPASIPADLFDKP